ncbi:MAG: patatin-like phospholipase family protein [Chitinophagales bacterium]
MKKTVSLVLGCGGARGLAHIGVIEAIEAAGYEIKAIAGTSMGAAVGAVYSVGKLAVFKEWFCGLTKFGVLKRIDFTFSFQGFVRGDRLFEEMASLVGGDKNIEDLEIPYTAVAADLNTGQEVWINRGSLFDAVRASIAIPTVFTPKILHDRELIDGGILNPTPIEPILEEKNDLIIVVNLNARMSGPQPRQVVEVADKADNLRLNMIPEPGKPGHFLFRSKWLHNLPKVSMVKHHLNYIGLTTRSIEVMQDKITDYTLHLYKPDILVNISRDASGGFDFYKAKELIELGRKECEAALNRYEVAQQELIQQQTISKKERMDLFKTIQMGWDSIWSKK